MIVLQALYLKQISFCKWVFVVSVTVTRCSSTGFKTFGNYCETTFLNPENHFIIR